MDIQDAPAKSINDFRRDFLQVTRQAHHIDLALQQDAQDRLLKEGV